MALSFGIVGCGRIASTHAKNMASRGKILAVCDIVEEKANALAYEYKAKAYYDFNLMLKSEASMEVISICTPNGLHASHSIAALNNRFHVICEKPMALGVQDCQDMIKASQIAERQLFIVKQNRYNPPVAAIKKLLEDGKLGKIYSLQMNFTIWVSEIEQIRAVRKNSLHF